MDGQYQHNRVSDKLLRGLSATDPPLDKIPLEVVLWDRAHLLSLAEDDARRSGL